MSKALEVSVASVYYRCFISASISRCTYKTSLERQGLLADLGQVELRGADHYQGPLAPGPALV